LCVKELAKNVYKAIQKILGFIADTIVQGMGRPEFEDGLMMEAKELC